MEWKINYYLGETQKFIDKLEKPEKARVFRELLELRTTGFSQQNDSLKKLVSVPGAWELKAKNCRIFLMQTFPGTIQVLGAIIKKSNKTPIETIELIKQRSKTFKT